MRDLILYSRRGCHLCEVMLEELEPLCRDRARLLVVDVDSDARWKKVYGEAVPVLCVGETEICRYHLEREAVLKILADDAA